MVNVEHVFLMKYTQDCTLLINQHFTLVNRLVFFFSFYSTQNIIGNRETNKFSKIDVSKTLCVTEWVYSGFTFKVIIRSGHNLDTVRSK